MMMGVQIPLMSVQIPLWVVVLLLSSADFIPACEKDATTAAAESSDQTHQGHT
jgi:hypothetical protein